ncbi:MAG: thermonuclease family protein [Allosphingosinicella sp.]|uniref:thermonuclease family protein n=1 Tax=Allosphingosinicella sp. TaxID=2823234 RepID=UPI0039321F6B
MRDKRGRPSPREWMWGLFGGAVIVLLALGFLWPHLAPAAEPATTFTCTATSVHDGDGPIRCREAGADGKPIRVRLSGIAARELDDSCSPGHPCPRASGAEAKASLERLALGQKLRCEQVGTSYGRAVAFCRTPAGDDLSCAQIRARVAKRWARHDPDGRLARC